MIRRSYGFRNIDSMPNMIYLTCSDLKIPLPNRSEEEVIAVLLLTSYPHLCLKILFCFFSEEKAYRARKDDGTVTISGVFNQAF